MGINEIMDQRSKDISILIEELPKCVLNMGDCINLKMPTNGGDAFWETKESINGYKLQRNRLTQHARILDMNDYRISWGSFDIMKEKFERLTGTEFLKRGDVIGIPRRQAGSLYAHYAVYLGEGKIIHYAAPNGDLSGRITVHEAGMKEFLRDDKDYFVLQFQEGTCNKPVKIQASVDQRINNFGLETFLFHSQRRPCHVYSADETIRRARSRLGEEAYNLFENNCEHFAIWCKTGVSESYQVSALKMYLNRMVNRAYDRADIL